MLCVEGWVAFIQLLDTATFVIIQIFYLGISQTSISYKTGGKCYKKKICNRDTGFLTVIYLVPLQHCLVLSKLDPHKLKSWVK